MVAMMVVLMVVLMVVMMVVVKVGLMVAWKDYSMAVNWVVPLVVTMVDKLDFVMVEMMVA